MYRVVQQITWLIVMLEYCVFVLFWLNVLRSIWIFTGSFKKRIITDCLCLVNTGCSVNKDLYSSIKEAPPQMLTCQCLNDNSLSKP